MNRTPGADRDVRVLTRNVLGLAVGAMGVVDLVSALLSRPPDRLQALRHLVPTDVLDTSRTFTLLAGALLVVTAWGLRRGKRRAFVAALLLCAVSVPVNLLKAFDFEEATMATALMFALGVSGDAFRVRSRALGFRILRLEFLVAVALLALYAIGGTWLLEQQFGHHVSLIRAFADTGYRMFGIGQPVELVPATLPAHARQIAGWYASSLPLLSLVLVVGVSLAALRPAFHRRRQRAERDRVRGLLSVYGDSTVAAYALDPETDYFFSPNQRAVLAYRFEAGVALVVGDPIGPPEEHRPLLAAFARFCEEGDWGIAFFQARPEYLPLYREFGWSALHLGEDPILWTHRFRLEGAATSSVRRAAGRACRAGLTVRHYSPDGRQLQPDHEDRALVRELRAVSDDWMARHPGGELGFCMGRFDPQRIAEAWLAVAWNNERHRIEAFVTWEPVWARRGWTLDLVRRRGDSASGTMELLIARSVEEARERGDAMVSLGLSALASVDSDGEEAREASESGAVEAHEPATAEDRARAFLRRQLGRFYDFEGLFRWKRKFAPCFEDRYLVHSGRMALPRVMLALVRAQSPSGLVPYLRGWLARRPTPTA